MEPLDYMISGVSGYSDYLITSSGVVLSLKRNRITGLKPANSSKGGYSHVCLANSKGQWGFKVHRLVAKAFLPNPNNYPQVNHIDGDKSNNDISNLEWCTNDYNYEHSLRTGLHNKPPMPVLSTDKDGNTTRYESIMSAERATGVSSGNISQVCRGVFFHAGGYSWNYEEDEG